ncbi:MAG TPA: hypothetical protein VF711_00195 [Acidimicrobiales bacterium]
MQPQIDLDLGGRAQAVDLNGAPLLGVVAKQRAAPGRVDVETVGQVSAQAVEEQVGVFLAEELPGLLGPVGVLPPPGPVPAVGPLLDARHGCLKPPFRTPI